MDAKQVLVIEDDASTATFLADNLRADGFAVSVVGTVGEARRAVESGGPDVALLDIGLGDASGLEVLDYVRGAEAVSGQVDRDLPVIVLSGRASEHERVRGFRRGADDYVVKPFSYPELLARMHAVLRRAEGRPARGAIRVLDLVVDPVSRRVEVAGRRVYLSTREFDLLLALSREPSRVFTKHALMRDVWGYAAAGTSRTVDTHACRLRRKLAGGARPYVQTVRGVGYRLMEDPA